MSLRHVNFPLSDTETQLRNKESEFSSLDSELMRFYNSAIGTLESRVLVSTRRFKDLGVGSSVGDLNILEPLETPTRSVRSSELTDGVT
jgi:hypothetical protein